MPSDFLEYLNDLFLLALGLFLEAGLNASREGIRAVAVAIAAVVDAERLEFVERLVERDPAGEALVGAAVALSQVTNPLEGRTLRATGSF